MRSRPHEIAKLEASIREPGLPPTASSDARGPSSAPPTSRALEGVRVLVVDDEEDVRDLLVRVLRHRGATVTAAADVGAALVAFDAAPPDVVVSDVGMPGRSGFDLARELRARPVMRATLIAVSGFTTPDEVERALDAGFDTHVAKPVEPAELVSIIRAAANANADANAKADASANEP